MRVCYCNLEQNKTSEYFDLNHFEPLPNVGDDITVDFESEFGPRLKVSGVVKSLTWEITVSFDKRETLVTINIDK